MVESLLSRLQGVKKSTSNQNKWMAKCPAHDDRSPSLSIKLADDDKILIKCFAGCSVIDIVTSIGLDLSDLFPKNPGNPIRKPRFNASDLIRLCVQESTILVIAIGDCLDGKLISDEDKTRVNRAIETISEIHRETQSWL